MSDESRSNTVMVNNQPIPEDVFRVIMNAAQKHKRKIIHNAKKAKTEGSRQADLRRVRILDEYMTLLGYATGVPFKPPKRPFH